MSSATAKAERERLETTVRLFAGTTLPGDTGSRWTAITCADYTRHWKALGGDALPYRQHQPTAGGPVLRIHTADGAPVLATLKFTGTARCHHMRYDGGKP